MKKVTMFGSSMVRLQLATFLLVMALSFSVDAVSAGMLFVVGWYAHKVFGDNNE